MCKVVIIRFKEAMRRLNEGRTGKELKTYIKKFEEGEVLGKMRVAEKGKRGMRVYLRKRKERKEEEEDGSDDGEQPTFHFSLSLTDHRIFFFQDS